MNPYEHMPPWGLPSSLILPDGNTAAVVSLMQRKAGLNRERRRELQASAKTHREVPSSFQGEISKTDWNVLTYYFNAEERYRNFWHVVKLMLRRHSVLGTKSYAVAVDVQLLDAYESGWFKLTLDSDALGKVCPEWPRIREALEGFWEAGKHPMPLGMFMLWPRLIEDLEDWEKLDSDQRLRVGHAIFALSSIGWTRWFIDEAVSRCPDLDSELGDLKTPPNPEAGAVDPCPIQRVAELDRDDKRLQGSVVGQATIDVTGKWSAIGAELARLQSSWQPSPARSVLTQITALGAEAAELLALLPVDKVQPRELLERGLENLRARLHEAANSVELRWLSGEDIEGITARWRIALANSSDEDAVAALAEDSEQALDRIAIAIDEAQSAQARVSDAKMAVTAAVDELAQQSSAIRRIELAKRLQDAKEAEIAAERKQTDVMLFVLASASPMGEAFDPAIDYVAELAAQSESELARGGEAVGVDDVGSTDEVLNGQPVAAEPPAEASTVQVEAVAIASASDPEDATADLAVEPTIVPPVDQTDDALPVGPVKLQESGLAPSEVEVAATNRDTVPVAREAIFTNAAGDQCRPIWSLLRLNKPALAYQFSQALQLASPELRIPPPALLRSVAFAPGLAASDGPLAMAIGEAFGDIDATWFEPGDSPSNWHTALNLLLISATLRPMILAPATGAAAIARYRHLDGRHSALLDLVRKVGEVSEPLTGFTIGPTVLRSAADEASQKVQLARLSADAEDWLLERAPSKKIRYAPASKVWLHWLKPGELIHRLVSPVVHGALDERNAVRTAIEELSDYDVFLERLRDTDRRQLQRRGQDIEAGALEHLWLATCEGVAHAKGWLAAVSLLSDSGGRLRALVAQLQAAFDALSEKVCAELDEHWVGDEWGQVAAASQVLRAEVNAIAGMFKQTDAVPVVEPQAKELLARDLLWVPGTSIGPGWVPESDGQVLLEALEAWSESPVDALGAFEVRVKVGDLAGAEMLIPLLHANGEDGGRVQSLERARDMWVKDLQQAVQRARRSSEVGLAYGYLSDTERAACESELSSVELGQRDAGRFDKSARRVSAVASRIEEQKARRIDEARREFDREKAGLPEDVAKQVEAPLARSDIHTFNELLQRVRQGAEPWPERDLRRDAFSEFHPRLQGELQGYLARMEPADVDRVISVGGSIGQLSFDLDGDPQARAEAEAIYRTWATSFSKRSLTRDGLRKILEALGVPVRSLEQDKLGMGWALQTLPIDDREVCPVPHFGSRAQGRYRVIILMDRLTPEDLLQRVGESTQQTVTIVLALAHSPVRFWPDLARLAKERQRSFLLLDESMLLFLLSQRGSRLATWFGISLPFTYSEPYDASAGFVPSEMFYGRASELASVMAQGGCYFIYGGRQLGKTALLRRAERTFHDPAADRYAVWVDLLAQGIGERRPAADVWLSVADKLRELRIAGLDVPVVNPAKPASIDTFLSAIKSFLGAKPGRRILLLLDEADHFFEQDGRQGSAYAETRRLKQLMDETERRFKVVFAGLHNVLRTASTSNQPLGHLNEAVRIGPLMDEREIRAAEDLITRPIEAAGFEFDDRSLVMRVLAQTNYYPSLIQLYCTQLLRHLRETKLRRRDMVGPRFKIDETDIESVFSGRPLRDAIRSKFRLTLQLDDRYEVIANAIGLEALGQGFDHAQGIDWRTIWQDCTTFWWPEGFATTSERDFLALLEEMVQLGVLSQAKTPDRFSLRNPNVLLLLGSRQEIEDTLQAEREPRIEFESTIFRPALGGRLDNPARNPLTYRQLDEVVQMRSSVLLVAASEAAGSGNLLSGLRDQPGVADARLFVQLDRASDRRSFAQELDKEVKRRVADGITVMLVPASVPWDAEWVTAARAKLNALKSVSSFVSVVFAADPLRLWALAAAVPERAAWVEPWLSVRPWDRGFVRKWLEELQFPTDAVDRLEVLTGFWGGLLESVARVKGGALDFANNLDRMEKLRDDLDWRRENRRRLTGGVEDAEKVLTVLLELGDGVAVNDLVEFGELPKDIVERTLLWAEPLGLVVRQAGGVWTIDPFFKGMLEATSQ